MRNTHPLPDKAANHTAFYQYDAAGERILKLSGIPVAQRINGRWQAVTNLEEAVLYASPYLVATPQGYTKHYYAGSERVASAIGGGGIWIINQCLDLGADLNNTMMPLHAPFETPPFLAEKLETNQEQLFQTLECLESEANPVFDVMIPLREFADPQHEENARYFYHTDHLGSSSWITDAGGQAVQHMMYLPFGEPWIDLQVSAFSTRYTFSGKERDMETGYGYFGARYYSSDLGIWLSVDPMAGKYPSLSPYTYCANNPIKLVDPNGMEVEYKSLSDRFIVGLTRIFNPEFRKTFKTLKSSEETYVFNHNGEGNSSFTTDGDKLYINYSLTSESRAGGYTVFSEMLHESEHAMQFEHGEIGFGKEKGEWTAAEVSYDITDELNAHNAMNPLSQMRRGSLRKEWDDAKTTDAKIEILRRVSAYKDLKRGPNDNPNTRKAKGPGIFMLPKKERRMP